MKIALSTSVIQRGHSGVARYVFELLEALLRQQGSHQYLVLVLEEDLPLFETLKGRVSLRLSTKSGAHPLRTFSGISSFCRESFGKRTSMFSMSRVIGA